MLATRNNRKKTKRFSDVTLTDTDTFEVDTVSPHDKDAIRAVSEQIISQDRLPSLIRGAARSRDLCEVHRCAAREAVSAARSAKQLGNGRAYRDYLESARDARRRANECRQFARECENRANALIMAGRSRQQGFSSAQEVIARDTSRDCPAESVER